MWFPHPSFPAIGAERALTDCPLIAVVDDDPSICRSLKRLLRSLGMEAQTFGSGEALLAALENPGAEFGCLILDVHMPGMSGLELKERVVGYGIPVVLITAHDDSATRMRAQATGTTLLRKPVEGDVLSRTLTELLGDRS